MVGIGSKHQEVLNIISYQDMPVILLYKIKILEKK